MDEDDTDAFTISWRESEIYVGTIVIMFTCVSLLNIDTTTMKFGTTRSKQCNISVPQRGNTDYKPLINEVSGQTAIIPVRLYFIRELSKGMVNVAIPCPPGLWREGISDFLSIEGGK